MGALDAFKRQRTLCSFLKATCARIELALPWFGTDSDMHDEAEVLAEYAILGAHASDMLLVCAGWRIELDITLSPDAFEPKGLASLLPSLPIASIHRLSVDVRQPLTDANGIIFDQAFSHFIARFPTISAFSPRSSPLGKWEVDLRGSGMHTYQLSDPQADDDIAVITPVQTYFDDLAHLVLPHIDEAFGTLTVFAGQHLRSLQLGLDTAGHYQPYLDQLDAPNLQTLSVATGPSRTAIVAIAKIVPRFAQLRRLALEVDAYFNHEIKPASPQDLRHLQQICWDAGCTLDFEYNSFVEPTNHADPVLFAHIVTAMHLKLHTVEFTPSYLGQSVLTQITFPRLRELELGYHREGLVDPRTAGFWQFATNLLLRNSFPNLSRVSLLGCMPSLFTLLDLASLIGSPSLPNLVVLDVSAQKPTQDGHCAPPTVSEREAQK